MKTFVTLVGGLLLIYHVRQHRMLDSKPNGKLQLIASPPPTIRSVAGIVPALVVLPAFLINMHAAHTAVERRIQPRLYRL